MHLPVVQGEPPQLYTDVDGVTWRRTGDCCRCGECCRGDLYDASLEFCAFYRGDADGGTCSDRTNPYYVTGCNVYPQVPSQIADKPRCSYRFERVTHGG